MGERRLVQELSRNSNTATGAADEQLRRLVANRDRVAAFLRAGRREPPVVAAAYRSSYAARLWALAEASELAELEPVPAGRAETPAPHLSLVAPADESGE